MQWAWCMFIQSTDTWFINFLWRGAPNKICLRERCFMYCSCVWTILFLTSIKINNCGYRYTNDDRKLQSAAFRASLIIQTRFHNHRRWTAILAHTFEHNRVLDRKNSYFGDLMPVCVWRPSFWNRHIFDN